MDQDLREEIENINEKIEKIRAFIALSLRRDNISAEARQIFCETEDVRHDIEKANHILKNEYGKLDKEYEAAMSRMQNQQARIMDYVIKERKRKLEEAQHVRQLLRKNSHLKPMQYNNMGKDLSHSMSKLLTPNVSRLNVEKTPKIYLSDYKASPLIKRNRVNPIPINFLDFDVTLLPEQFDRIPKYLRGRESFSEFNEFFENVIIPCFNEKYELLHRQRGSIRGPDLELFNIYKEQIAYVPGRNFITVGDMARKMNRVLDKKSFNRLVMLRHIGLLKEQRVGTTTCYIWNQS